MKKAAKSSLPPPRLGARSWKHLVLFAGLVLAIAIGAWSWLHSPASPNDKNITTAAGIPTAAKTPIDGGSNSGSNSAGGVDAVASQPKAARPLSATTFSWFQSRPLKVSQTNGIYAWTAEDGKDTNIIRQLAHNELEYQRMLTENGAIYRRQLVYFAQGFAPLAQQVMQAGQPLRQITLPGLDGQELTVNVTRTEFKNGGSQGQIYGQLPGQSDSMVTLAFIDSREAFTVNSPQNQIYLVGEAREPGEVVVKSVNPALYGKPMN